MPDPAPGRQLHTPHLKISEIAELWNISEDTARRLFTNEPGVLHLGQPSRLLKGRSKKYKRGYTILRIPRAVFERVEARLMHGHVGPERDLGSGGGGELRAS